MAKSTTIRSLAIAFTARTDRFKKGIKRMVRRLKSFKKTIGGVVKAIARIGVGIAAAFVGGAAAIFAITNRVTQMGDKFAKAAKATGITVENLSALGFAAERSGSSIDAVLKSIGVFAKNASMAADGLATYTREFDKLGVSIKDEKGELKDIKDLFLETGDAISKLQSNTQRLGTAKTLFGRGGAELLPLFLEGEKGIQRLIDRASELGVVWNSTQAAMAERFQDSLTDMKSAFGGLVREVVLVVAPKIIKAMTFVTEFIVQNRDKIVRAWTTAVNFISNGFKKLATKIREFGESGFIDNVINRLIIGFRAVFFDIPRLAIRAFKVIVEGIKFIGREIKRIFLNVKFEILDLMITVSHEIADIFRALPITTKIALGISDDLIAKLDDAKSLRDAIIETDSALGRMNAADRKISPFQGINDSVDELKKAGNEMLDFVDKQLGKKFVKDSLFTAIKDAWIAAGKFIEGLKPTKIQFEPDSDGTGGDIAKALPITERPGALERGSAAAFSAGVADPFFRAMEKPMQKVAKNTTSTLKVMRQQLNELREIADSQSIVVDIL